MRWLLLALIFVHGLIHFMGPAKAFGLAELPQLTQPISRGMGVVWLAAGVLMMVAGVAFLRDQRVWWVVATVAVALSQIVIFASWTDAKFGTLANAVILAAAIYGFVSQGS